MKKIIIAVLCSVAVVGLAIYEAYSITIKEYERQSEIASEAQAEIEMGINMIKVAVQTEDVEVYEKNLAKVREEMAKIEPLQMVRSEYSEYMGQLGEQVALLESRVDILTEMKSLKTQLDNMTEALKTKYGNKDEISRDKVKASKDAISKLKIQVEQYKTEPVKNVTNTVNEMLDGMAGKVGRLANCVDECYKDKIKEINDELAEALKGFLDKAPELNKKLVREFGMGLGE